MVAQDGYGTVGTVVGKDFGSDRVFTCRVGESLNNVIYQFKRDGITLVFGNKRLFIV